jgi:hypothetical protein
MWADCGGFELSSYFAIIAIPIWHFVSQYDIRTSGRKVTGAGVSPMIFQAVMINMAVTVGNFCDGQYTVVAFELEVLWISVFCMELSFRCY